MEESMKNYIDWVWGYGEGDAKKNMWSNRQKKNCDDRGWDCMGKETQNLVEKSTKICNDREWGCMKRGGDRRNNAWKTSMKD